MAKNWNKHTYGIIFEQLIKIENNLQQIQQEILIQPTPEKIIKQNNILRQKESILNTHKIYWKQRAKTKHIKLNDTNFGYFHKIASGKRTKKNH